MRENTLQSEISTSISVLDSETIENAGTQHFEDILSLVPNLNWSGGTNRPRYFQIRGIGERSQYEGAPNPSVGFIVDDIDFSALGGVATLFDVEQIEVLRGPQGTLFGRNSTAGLVHFISRKPTEEQEGYLNFEYGSYGTNIVETAISGPISDQVRGRLALKYHQDDGFQDNQGPAGGKLGVTDRIMGRAHLDIDINDDMMADFAAKVGSRKFVSASKNFILASTKLLFSNSSNPSLYDTYGSILSTDV